MFGNNQQKRAQIYSPNKKEEAGVEQPLQKPFLAISVI